MSWRKLASLFVFFTLTGTSYAQDCYQTSIVSPSPFLGNDGEILKLSDGALWEVKYSYEYLYEYSPNVIICPAKGKLLVRGKTITVISLAGTRTTTNTNRQKQTPTTTSALIESQIDGEFSGWDGETIFKLTNGQIWQQSSYAYTYSYKYRPNVMIISINGGFELKVEGIDQRIRVVRIK